MRYNLQDLKSKRKTCLIMMYSGSIMTLLNLFMFDGTLLWLAIHFILVVISIFFAFQKDNYDKNILDIEMEMKNVDEHLQK